MDISAWVTGHPAEVAWAVFAFLAALVAAYRAKEADIKDWAASTPNDTDDKVVAVMSRVVAALVLVLDIVRQVMPLAIARPTPAAENADKKLKERR